MRSKILLLLLMRFLLDYRDVDESEDGFGNEYVHPVVTIRKLVTPKLTSKLCHSVMN